MNPVDIVELYIYQESTYTHRIKITNEDGTAINLIGYTAMLEMRADTDSATVLHQSTTGNGELSVVDSGDVDVNSDPIYAVDIKIPGAVTGDWSFDSSEYDLFIISPTSEPTAVARGPVTVYPSITINPV